MANPEHLRTLKEGVATWNSWRGKNHSIKPDLSGANLSGLDLTGINLSDGDMSGADLSRACLSRANLNCATLRDAGLINAKLNNASLIKAQLDGAKGNGADFSDADLSGANLSGAALEWANFGNANLTNADLRGARLRLAKLIGANLGHANLAKTSLIDVKVKNIDLSTANLNKANLEGLDLGELNLSEEARYNEEKRRARVSRREAVNRLLRELKDKFYFHHPEARGPINASYLAYEIPGAKGGRRHDEAPAPQPDALYVTAFSPIELEPGKWYSLLTYVHLASALEKVLEDERILGSYSTSYRKKQYVAKAVIERGAEIVVVPEMAGCRFNPPRASVLWLEDWHCIEFKMQPSPELPGYEVGGATNGRLAFYVGPVLIAEVRLRAFFFDQDAEDYHLDDYAPVTSEPYQSIFVSYSHKDSNIVKQLEKAYKVLGLQYLRDVNMLRSGEEWDPALLKKIEEANIFQLCWSTAAKESPNVEREWRHALELHRQSFMRPVYWEKPMPIPPPELNHIHFSYLEEDS